MSVDDDVCSDCGAEDMTVSLTMGNRRLCRRCYADGQTGGREPVKVTEVRAKRKSTKEDSK